MSSMTAMVAPRWAVVVVAEAGQVECRSVVSSAARRLEEQVVDSAASRHSQSQP